MNTEQIARLRRWADALESGEYRQTRQKLRDTSGYCCLGVACDLAKNDLGIEWIVNSIDSPGADSIDGEHCTMPSSVRDYYGLRDQFGCEIHKTSLSSLNDDDLWTFAEIAPLIRAKADEWEVSLSA